ncbi:MAG TPA: undecaprenyl-diphosphate phosphatase [Chryseolinea sp.]
MSIFHAILLAIIEGLTEFLPISSTGHMIIGSSLMGIASDPFTKMFTVAIQLGAIVSVLVLYWRRFFPEGKTLKELLPFYYKLILAFIPAGVLGLLLNDYIDALLERVDVVGYMLVVGGVFFLFVDNIFRESENAPDREITFSTAWKIGLFQIISLVPGVSRSAATIIGGLAQKLNKKSAAEFSFFLAVPTMFAATGYKIFKFYMSGGAFGSHEITLLAVGNIVAFIVAILAIKSFVTFLTRHGFKLFGYYRIAMGALILILYYLGVGLTVV